MKKSILDACIERNIRCKDGAKFLKMHAKAFSRLKTRYIREGESALIPKKPGPKHFTPFNRTSKEITEKVKEMAIKHPDLGPVNLADELFTVYGIILHPTTIWRVLKREKVRYTTEYKRWKQEPKMYCLDTPGEELQLDGCYPFGRSRKIVHFDAIDDCSRWVYGRLYDRETAENAIDFVRHLIKSVPFRVQRIRIDNRYGKKFVEFCNSLSIEVIENEPYSPEQNGKIERFHKTLKREFYWKYCSYNDSIETMKFRYILWQNYYNTERKHQGYGMSRLTPRQKIASTLLLSLTNTYPQKVALTLQQYNS